MIEILHRYTKAVLYKQETAADIAEAVIAAALSRANLIEANLSRANLSGANLSRANLSGADLSRADLSGAAGIVPTPLQILGTRHALIVFDYGKVEIGCHHFSIQHWEAHFEAIGAKENYTAQQIEEYGEYIALCRRHMERYGLLIGGTG